MQPYSNGVRISPSDREQHARNVPSTREAAKIYYPLQKVDGRLKDISTRLQQVEAQGKETQRLLLELNEVRV